MTKNKPNKDFFIGLLIAILMIVIEVFCLFVLKNKLSSSEYSSANINMKNIITMEFLVLAFVEVVCLTLSFKKENVRKLTYIICILLLFINFYLISFQFCSYGNFINTCILLIYNKILNNKK